MNKRSPRGQPDPRAGHPGARTASMEAIGRCVRDIAHDFNNVLGTIVAYAEMLHDKVAAESPQKRHAESVLTAAARGRALVDQILAYCQGTAAPERTSTDLGCIVAETLALLCGSLRPQIALSWHPPATPILVVADATQLHRVTMNLCSNAVHALAAGGWLRVGITTIDVTVPYEVSHGMLRRGSYARLTVDDSGCGMDEATLAAVFEPFFTTKRAIGGTGLGLSLVRAIVTDLDGAIDVRSAAGYGTTFAVFLPLEQDARLQSRSRAR
jgi:signal transduction histidine kinase